MTDPFAPTQENDGFHSLTRSFENERLCWNVGSLFLPLSDNKDIDREQKIDLIEVIEKKSNNGDHLWFPSTMVGNKTAIMELIQDSLKDCTIVAESIKPSKNKKYERHYFRCPRWLLSTATTEKGENNTHSKRAPCADKRCTFTLVVCHETNPTANADENKNHGRWFINPRAHHNFCHCHHLPYPTHYRPSLQKSIPAKYRDRLREMYVDKMYTSRTFQAVCNSVTNNDVPIEVVRSFIGQIQGDQSESSTKTPAQQLLEYLEANKDAEFVCYTASRAAAKDHLVRLRRRNRRSVQDIKTRNAEHALGLQELLNGLAIDDSQEVLVAIAWVSRKQQSLYRAFPECLGMDVTNGVNNETRPLFRLIGRTSDNKNIPLLAAFLPSLCKWVFDWLFAEVIPQLLGEDEVRNLRIITTDEDPNQIEPFRNLAVDFYPDAEHRLCKWHKTENYKPHPKTDQDHSFVRTVKDWCYSFCNDIESRDEEVLSKNALDAFVLQSEREGVTPSVIVETQEFLTMRFYPALRHICKRHYMYVPSGDRDHNCATESDNASLKDKRSVSRPCPNHNLFQAGARIFKRDQEYVHRLIQKSREALVTTIKPHKNETKAQELLRNLSFDIVERKARMAVEQWSLGTVTKRYSFKSELSDHPDKQVFSVENICLPVQSSSPIIRFHRIRTVTITKLEAGGCRFECSCGFYERLGVPCRHFYRVTQQDPSKFHIHPNNWKVFLPMADECPTSFKNYARMAQDYGNGMPMRFSPLPAPLYGLPFALLLDGIDFTDTDGLDAALAVDIASPTRTARSASPTGTSGANLVTPPKLSSTDAPPKASPSDALSSVGPKKENLYQHLQRQMGLLNNFCVTPAISSFAKAEVQKVVEACMQKAVIERGHQGTEGIVGYPRLTAYNHTRDTRITKYGEKAKTNKTRKNSRKRKPQPTPSPILLTLTAPNPPPKRHRKDATSVKDAASVKPTSLCPHSDDDDDDPLLQFDFRSVGKK